jgi:hypothetical protein
MYSVYRAMRSVPTIALARAAASAPIKLTQWSYQTTDDAPDDAMRFVQEAIDPLLTGLVRDLLYALDYGSAAFERVWEIRDGALVYQRVKYLMPDDTTPIVDETGKLCGLMNKGVRLPVESSMIYVYDAEGDDLRGRSRHENIRQYAYLPWIAAVQRMRDYTIKHAGITPIVTYPEGESQDITGTRRSNATAASEVIQRVGKGSGVIMPNTLAPWAEDAARSGADVTKLSAWRLEFLSAPSGAGYEILASIRQLEANMARGWLVPERAILEGQFGTKAEAGEHGSIASVIANEVVSDIEGVINKWLIGPMLAANYGEYARQWVSIRASQTDAATAEFVRQVLQAVLTAPSNIDLATAMVDFDALLDQAGLPKAEEVVDASDPVVPMDRGSAVALAAERLLKHVKGLGSGQR